MSDSRQTSCGRVDELSSGRLLHTDPADDGPIWMVDLTHYREGPGDDGRVETLAAMLRDLGAEVVFLGDVDLQLVGDEPAWDRVAVVKYPSRRSFIDMQRRDEFESKQRRNDAHSKQTLVVATVPIPWRFGPATVNEVSWTDVAHPPTASDEPVVVVQVEKYKATSADVTAEMEGFERAASMFAIEHGIRILGWFAVESTVVGDGRTWDQVRFHCFPSKAAFLAVVERTRNLPQRRAYREAVMADNYTLVVRASVDRLVQSSVL